MKCTKCQYRSNEELRFCPLCGNQMIESKTEKGHSKASYNWLRGLLKILLSLCLVITIGLMVIWFLFNYMTQSKQIQHVITNTNYLSIQIPIEDKYTKLERHMFDFLFINISNDIENVFESEDQFRDFLDGLPIDGMIAEGISMYLREGLSQSEDKALLNTLVASFLNNNKRYILSQTGLEINRAHLHKIEDHIIMFVDSNEDYYDLMRWHVSEIQYARYFFSIFSVVWLIIITIIGLLLLLKTCHFQVCEWLSSLAGIFLMVIWLLMIGFVFMQNASQNIVDELPFLNQQIYIFVGLIRTDLSMIILGFMGVSGLFFGIGHIKQSKKEGRFVDVYK